jgi:type IV pilus assembly protein PilW
MRRHLLRTPRRQRGFSLIELLVALGLGLVVVVIAATALLLGQQGYRTVDTTTQLRDRERFTADLLARVIVQAGYQDLGAATVSLRSSAVQFGQADPEPDIYGWNDAVYATPEDLILSETSKIADGNRPAKCGTVGDTSCKNGSDILVIRYQGVTSPTDSTKSDNTMINCRGEGEAGLSTGNLNDRAASIFHVTRDTSGEPSLSCSYYNFSSAGGGWVASTPLIEGVESFQVLYGTDGVTPGLAPSVAQDTVAERWLRADQLTVAGNATSTRENWRRVRAVRIGLVMRGPVGSAQQAVATTSLPFGSMYASNSDTGSSLTVAADRRLRLQSTFTVHVRNDLTLK